jgi:hypothetical protein
MTGVTNGTMNGSTEKKVLRVGIIGCGEIAQVGVIIFSKFCTA